MFIREEWINRTEGYNCGRSDQYEPFTDNIGELFKSLQKEWGKCVSKMHRDTKDGVIHIGWVFHKKVQYEDCKDYYIRETWVTLYDKEDETTVESFEHVIN